MQFSGRYISSEDLDTIKQISVTVYHCLSKSFFQEWHIRDLQRFVLQQDEHDRPVTVLSTKYFPSNSNIDKRFD